MRGALHEYRSIDAIDSYDPEEIANYPTEVLNSFDVSGIPTHLLKMKVGAVVILLKNIYSRQGLCNGTRLIIRALRDNLIVAEIAAGKNKGHVVYIPRMMMSQTDSDLPVILKRLQFPVLLAFAMTITKSQGLLIASAFYSQNPYSVMASCTWRFQEQHQKTVYFDFLYIDFNL